MALAVSGCRVELREVSLKAKPDEMLVASPKGTVPVLVLADGAVIDESLDIMHWALQQNDPLGWLDCDLDAAQGLIEANDGPFKQALDRTKYSNRFAREDVSSARRDALNILAGLNGRLERHSYLLGECPSLADVALFPFIRQFAQIDRAQFESDGLGALSNWLKGLECSSLFGTVMVRTENWSAGHKATIWPQDGLAQ